MKVGLVGESPHDTRSIYNLLSRMYPDLTFVNLIDDIHGSQLDQMQPTKQLLRLEYQIKKPDVVIFIRDLDALHTDFKMLRKRMEYFREFRSVVDQKAVFLLNIYEIEALILCDLDAFRNYYVCGCDEVHDPHLIEEPKEYLKATHRKYNEIHNPEIFRLIDLDRLLARSVYFNRFVGKFAKILAAS